MNRDANESTDSADWMLGKTTEISTVVFIGEVPHTALVLIEGCAIWVSYVDVLVSALSSDTPVVVEIVGCGFK